MFKYLVASLLFVTPALAHETVSGWSYDAECCDDQDCVPMSAEDVKTYVELTPEGVYIKHFDQMFLWHQVRKSGDNEWHWCVVYTSETATIQCIYIPEMMG